MDCRKVASIVSAIVMAGSLTACKPAPCDPTPATPAPAVKPAAKPLMGSQRTIDLAQLELHMSKARATQIVEALNAKGFHWFKFVGGRIVGVN